mmetsp:Transcript_37962/g.87847  ORF Transcript_37962/g.87847 Transcript_37962/m.87847 type:complete len:235 (+) Transcript_37962:1950-2654(+)
MVVHSHCQAVSCSILQVFGSRERNAASITGLKRSKSMSAPLDMSTMVMASRSHSSSSSEGIPARWTRTAKTFSSSSIQASVVSPMTSLLKAHIFGKLLTAASSSSRLLASWMWSQSALIMSKRREYVRLTYLRQLPTYIRIVRQAPIAPGIRASPCTLLLMSSRKPSTTIPVCTWVTSRLRCLKPRISTKVCIPSKSSSFRASTRKPLKRASDRTARGVLKESFMPGKLVVRTP